MLFQWLRDQGMKAVYLGTYQTPKSVAKAALQEVADVVGPGLLSE